MFLVGWSLAPVYLDDDVVFTEMVRENSELTSGGYWSCSKTLVRR